MFHLIDCLRIHVWVNRETVAENRFDTHTCTAGQLQHSDCNIEWIWWQCTAISSPALLSLVIVRWNRMFALNDGVTFSEKKWIATIINKENALKWRMVCGHCVLRSAFNYVYACADFEMWVCALAKQTERNNNSHWLTNRHKLMKMNSLLMFFFFFSQILWTIYFSPILSFSFPWVDSRVKDTVSLAHTHQIGRNEMAAEGVIRSGYLFVTHNEVMFGTHC